MKALCCLMVHVCFALYSSTPHVLHIPPPNPVTFSKSISPSFVSFGISANRSCGLATLFRKLA